MESIDFEKKLKQINERLEKGELPDCLNYTESNKKNCNIDWNMLMYNSFYKSLEYSHKSLIDEYNKKKNEEIIVVHSER